MAAAALGNTFSDLLGIGSAWYVESLADKLGARPPDLSAEQLEMRSSRVAANLGRALGVFVGCVIGSGTFSSLLTDGYVLGMFPLLFIDSAQSKQREKESLRNSD